MAGKAQKGEAQEGKQFVNPDLSSHHSAHHYFCLSICESLLQLVIPFVKAITAREEKEGTRDQGAVSSEDVLCVRPLRGSGQWSVKKCYVLCVVCYVKEKGSGQWSVKTCLSGGEDGWAL